MRVAASKLRKSGIAQRISSGKVISRSTRRLIRIAVSDDLVKIRQAERRKVEIVTDQSFELPGGKFLHISSDHSKHKGTKFAFLGTSLFPGRTEPCLLVKNEGRCFIFNCGDNVYRELQRASYLEKQCTIFVTSMDINNIVGLPGLLSPGVLPPPVVIYGPQGLRQYIRATLRACFARVPTKYTVHELLLNNDLRVGNQQSQDLMHEDELYGDDLLCSGNDSYPLVEDDHLNVISWSLCQKKQSCGFIYKETGTSGNSIALVSRKSERVPWCLKAKDVDVLVHEIDNTIHGAQIAGDQAKAINAKSLVMSGCSRTGSQELEAAKSRFGKASVALSMDHVTFTLNNNG
ncbi:hypothetical protein SELMODRAFT_408964 [Selaginella moellendorffii]|uniref:Metallo-beta-lactamase domain-containing protein n=1 Tax=Selaginella moellendorffii TaxID=88036 RepID=D8R913_SELML|nr:hypothetical protein SELMODRAFT_408964 [Selaginella moellendorffii]